jgi:hypothetical protein
MLLNTNQKEFITSVALSILEGYKICLACLLSIFVPQFCPDTQTTCTISQNFSDLDHFNKFVVAFNFITLFVFLLFLFAQNSRERYIINHLEIDPSKGDNTLQENIQQTHPFIFQRIIEHNKRCLISTKVTGLFFIMNTIISCVLVCYFFYDGFRTVTSLLANILLVTTKLYTLFDINQNCLGEKILALSAFRSSPESYNIIDPNYSNKQQQKQTHIELNQINNNE